MTLVQRFENLLAVPSYHYHPTFAQEVQTALATVKPTAIALEVSKLWAEEFKWGVSCWPCPMVSFAHHIFAPIIPGDSMVEAYRLGRQSDVPIFFVDLELADPIERTPGGLVPDPAFASRIGNLFIETIDAVDKAVTIPADGDVAREAYMASRLSDLLKRFERVLWVGGMAHWTRMRARLERKDFDGPTLPRAIRPDGYLRMRLEWSALHRFTQRLPFQVAQFARQPYRYNESACLSRLALAAVKPEKFEAEEVAAMLVYARNLATMTNLAETPDLWELLTSSSSTLGNEYASRLASLALKDRFTEAGNQFPMLTHSVEHDPEGKPVGLFRCEGKLLQGEPLWGSREAGLVYRKLPSWIEIKQRRKNNPAKELKPAKSDAKRAWTAYPADEKSYEAFIRHVLTHASRADSQETSSEPLTTGLGEGVDVRETIRHWVRQDIYVRQPVRSLAPITNGLIDWTSHSENSWILQNNPTLSQDKPYADATDGGWIDPDLLGAGSASWTVREPVRLQSKPFLMQRVYRELSLITLDTPTWIKGESGTRKSFYDSVILQLLALEQQSDNNIYGWLEIMFKFCRNKPFAYYSHYKPSPRIFNIGRQFGVRIIHVPLTRISEQMLNQHRSFKFMWMTRDQWEELLDRFAESNRAWTATVTESTTARAS